ncbi:GntR family transcriptional regulator [Streptomyces tailanensis]|uniref:GntR family transcriptional regulator n=1 Tax=Streptomyces tailanensis TaxID=2569858 RepID=UPI00122E8E1B|nr:GntR family transcriptional regulator [Streptomyces tailanensis]
MSHKAREVANALRQRIQGGTYAPGDWLPQTRILADEFGVAASTICRATARLQGERLIGSGRRRLYVIDPENPDACPRSSGRPQAGKAATVESALRKRIADGTYAPGDWLPTLDTLADEFGVAVSTVSVATAWLQQDGLVGSGRRRLYVIDPNKPDISPRLPHTDIEEILRKRLADGTYTPGSRLPSQAELAKEFGTHSNMVKEALRPIRSAGLVYYDQLRCGTYVADPEGTQPVPHGARPIEAAVRKRIRNGTYAPRTWLPSLRKLGDEFSVSTTTVSLALAPLQRERLVGAASRSRGLYVIDPDNFTALPDGASAHTLEELEGFFRTRLSDGTYEPGSRLPSRSALAEELSVGIQTITRALQPIRADGLITVNAREGTYASRRGRIPTSS